MMGIRGTYDPSCRTFSCAASRRGIWTKPTLAIHQRYFIVYKRKLRLLAWREAFQRCINMYKDIQTKGYDLPVVAVVPGCLHLRRFLCLQLALSQSACSMFPIISEIAIAQRTIVSA
jgi:hypothetical protein